MRRTSIPAFGLLGHVLRETLVLGAVAAVAPAAFVVSAAIKATSSEPVRRKPISRTMQDSRANSALNSTTPELAEPTGQVSDGVPRVAKSAKRQVFFHPSPVKSERPDVAIAAEELGLASRAPRR